jgi:circadian clock protein KaiC
MTNERSDDHNPGSTPASPPLDPTGVPGLDEVLGGGIQRGSLAIITGPPGSGKTVLAHHLAFSAARGGRRTTVLTAFSEPTHKLIAHMQPFAFFDPILVGQTLDVLSIQQLLRQGMDAAVQEIVSAVRATKANLVVLDGFRGVREAAQNPAEARQFIYDVSNRLNVLGITLLVTSEVNARDEAFFPEATTADVLLGLAFDVVGARERRTVEVLKIRGAAPLGGRHALTISEAGVTISPRLEARVIRLAGLNRPLAHPHTASAGPNSAPGESSAAVRVHTGVPGLDALLGGGISPGTSTLVLGGHGAGKTLFSLQLALEGVRAGQPSLFVSFRETADQLALTGRPFRWGADLAEALRAGALTVVRTPPVELRADVLADTLLALLDETRARRLVLDEIGAIESALVAEGYAHRFGDFLAALLEALRLHGVTSLLTARPAQTHRTRASSVAAAAALVTNLMWLGRSPRDARVERTLVIVRTALSGPSGVRYPVTIQPPEGIAVLREAIQGHGDALGQQAIGAEDENHADDER